MATLRAVMQLGAVALVIQAIFDHLGLSGLFVLVMLVAAAWTSARRMMAVSGAIWLPLEAAQVQLTVLFALLGAEALPVNPRRPIAGPATSGDEDLG